MRDRVVAQFRRPSGWAGRVVGWVMARRPSNRQRNRWTVDLLGLRPTDRVLEIGFGPGLALERAAGRVTQGEIVGIDHSQTMLAQASSRNAREIRDGRMRLMIGAAEELDAARLGRFDAIYSINVSMFWRDPAAVFAKLHELLAPGGVLATTHQPRQAKARPEDADAMAERLSAWLKAASFERVRTERLALEPIPAVCVLGHRAP